MEGDLFFSFWVKEHDTVTAFDVVCSLETINKQKDAVFLSLSIDNPSSSSQRLLRLAIRTQNGGSWPCVSKVTVEQTFRGGHT